MSFDDTLTDSLPIPPLDPLFFSSDLPLPLDDNYDFDITFDDLDDLISDPPIDAAWSAESAISGDSNDVVVDTYLKPSPSSCDSSGDVKSSDSTNEFPDKIQNSGSGNTRSDSDSGNFDPNAKLERESSRVAKRKKENCEESSKETTRSRKLWRSENSGQCEGVVSEEEEKRTARLMRNRESAQLSRQRRKHYVEELEDKVRSYHSSMVGLHSKVSYLMAENASLRQQLNSGNGMCQPPPMYPPMPPMAYPWVPCPPYVVKPQGSQVPLVPIPRLKPQQPAPAGKPRKGDNKKGEAKTKKIASVSLFGLLFFVLLFGGLVPVVDFKFGGVRENGKNVLGFVNERSTDQGRSNVLVVNRHSNGTHVNVGGRNGCSEYDADRKGGTERLAGTNNFDNGSEPLVASLYVPRNDKLVKIDGNLIIHSVLASERAMASHDVSEKDNTQEKGLAIPTGALVIPDVVRNRAKHSHSYQTSTERKKALASGRTDSLKDQKKSSVSEGKLQQWFHEGLAGPMLSSGLCSEVFQFDTSPTPGAIVAAPSVTNVTTGRQENATHVNKRKNRRTLRGLPIPFASANLNISGEDSGRQSQKDNFQGNKSVSPMVVSVLLDPREAGDGDVDGGVMKPKSLSRIFVVVLLDSVKYVTYSCMLPRAGPQLVTT